MSLAGVDRKWEIYLGHTAACVRGNAGAIWFEAQGHTELLARIGSHLEKHAYPQRWWQRRARIEVWLSGFHVRPFLLPPMQGELSAHERRTVAHQLAMEKFDGHAPLSIWLQSTSSALSSSLAVAMPSGLIDHLTQLAQSLSCHLVSASPWWAMALDQASASVPEARLILVEDSDVLTVLTEDEQGVFDSAECLPVGQQSAAGVAALIKRLSMAANISMSARVMSSWPSRAQLNNGFPAIFLVNPL